MNKFLITFLTAALCLPLSANAGWFKDLRRQPLSITTTITSVDGTVTTIVTPINKKGADGNYALYAHAATQAALATNPLVAKVNLPDAMCGDLAGVNGCGSIEIYDQRGRQNISAPRQGFSFGQQLALRLIPDLGLGYLNYKAQRSRDRYNFLTQESMFEAFSNVGGPGLNVTSENFEANDIRIGRNYNEGDGTLYSGSGRSIVGSTTSAERNITSTVTTTDTNTNTSNTELRDK